MSSNKFKMTVRVVIPVVFLTMAFVFKDNLSRIQISLFQLVLCVFMLSIVSAIVYSVHSSAKKKKRQQFKSREHNLLKILIDQMPDFMYIKDTKGRFIIANRYLTENVRVKDPKDIIGKTDFDFYPEKLARGFYEDEQKIIRTKKSMVQKEEEVFDMNYRKMTLSSTKVPWTDPQGNVLGIIGIGRDITKQKAVEQELLTQTKNLQEINVLLEEKHDQINNQAEELAAQSENLKLLNQELQKINETKDKFISIIAHDLKNPFNAIINFSELLILKNDLTPKQEEMINIINSSSKMAYSLLENLLYWGKSQSSGIPFRPTKINIPEIIREIIDFHEVSARLKNIVIRDEAGCENEVFADHTMITCILRNLVSNAIKFTPKNGEIKIKCNQNGRRCEITVTDNGLGITESQMPKLFRSNVETSKGTSGESGTGLGLVLSKEFARRNGGDIFVKSESGKGSSFILSLPLPSKDSKEY